MAQNENDRLNRIEELKGKLFSKNSPTKAEHRDSFTHIDEKDVAESWQDKGKAVAAYSGKFFVRTPIFKNFFIFSIVFFILTLSYGAYVFFVGGNTVSNNNIDISVTGNTFTAGGDELSLVIGITNRNSSPLDLVDLIMEYPKSASNSDDPGNSSASGMEHFRESLGSIPAGAVRNESLKVVLFGEQGSVIPIKISIEYRVQGSNAIFVKEKLHEVTVNSTPLNLSIDAPDTITPNQEITLKIKATLNATRPVEKMLLKVEYPAGFQFISSVPPPSLSNNAWSLGDFAPGAERTISVTGKMLDVFDGEAKTFRVSSGSQSSSDKSLIDVIFNTAAHTVTVKKPFIETQLYVNGVYERDYAIGASSDINAEIHWSNNLDTSVNDLEIRAKIRGNAVDRKSINVRQGFYNSSDDEIVWDKNSQKNFDEIDPGDAGSVSFTMSPLPLFSGNSGLLSDPSITVEVSINGKQSLEGFSIVELHNTESTAIKIISDVGFTGKALYGTGPFTNTGPMPPKAEQETTYTIVWTLSNTANPISKATIRSSIPSWVKFKGPISPADADLTYNSSSREIIWDIGKIPKGTGITGAEKTAAFQIGFTPSLSQVGTSPVILNDSTLTGHDDFANVDVRAVKSSLRSTGDGSIYDGGVTE